MLTAFGIHQLGALLFFCHCVRSLLIQYTCSGFDTLEQDDALKRLQSFINMMVLPVVCLILKLFIK
jgi:hypothetical protein